MPMGTPTFFVNGKRYNGQLVEALKPIIECQLKAVAGSSGRRPLKR